MNATRSPNRPSSSRPIQPDGNQDLRPKSLDELVAAQIRRECRKCQYDWDDFIAAQPEATIAKAVHPRTRTHGLNVSLDDVGNAINALLAQWTANPDQRPTEAGFREEQANRGATGRASQRIVSDQRAEQVQALLHEGLDNNAEIGRRLGICRSTVSRIRRRIKSSATDDPNHPAPTERLQPSAVRGTAFPAPELPPHVRWPTMQFMLQTGLLLDAADARWLCDIGQCYETEGQTDDLMRAIRAASQPGVKDPFAYLQTCAQNRADAWSVSADLLADVMERAGREAFEYALDAIASRQVERPLPYLTHMLARAVAVGQKNHVHVHAPIATAVRLTQDRAPDLVIPDAEAAIAAEAERYGPGGDLSILESYRRRHGGYPWEIHPPVEQTEPANLPDEPDGEPETPATDSPRLDGLPEEGNQPLAQADQTPEPSEDCCIGLKDPGDDLSRFNNQDLRFCESSPFKADATPAAEPSPCRHPVAGMLVANMSIDEVTRVNCDAGCGHWFYSDRGGGKCPCHWPQATASRVSSILSRPGSATASHGWPAELPQPDPEPAAATPDGPRR